jgi:hypothetical protein
MSVDLELAQIILASVVKRFSKRPLRRVLQMHRVDFSPSDSTAALRKTEVLFEAFASRKEVGFPSFQKISTRTGLSTVRADWPTLIHGIKKRAMVEAFNHAISADALATFVFTVAF